MQMDKYRIVETVNSTKPFIAKQLTAVDKQITDVGKLFLIPVADIRYRIQELEPEDPEEPDEPEDLDDPFYIFKEEIKSLNETIGNDNYVNNVNMIYFLEYIRDFINTFIHNNDGSEDGNAGGNLHCLVKMKY
jgi:hypothetical protein